MRLEQVSHILTKTKCVKYASSMPDTDLTTTKATTGNTFRFQYSFDVLIQSVCALEERREMAANKKKVVQNFSIK